MSLTRIGSIGINTGIAFAGVTTIVTLNTANDALSIGATVNVGSGITLGASGDIFATGVSTFSGNLKVGSGVTISPDGDGFYTGVVTATTFSGALSGSGANITAINASNIASGTVPTARLGSGTASSSTFLRGDSTFQTITTDLVGDTSPQLGGDLASNGNDILFADSDKAIFGTGSDLKIYHNGTDNYIMASNGHIRFDTGSAELARITSDGKLLIGTQTEGEASADDLTIGGSGNQGITIRSGTSNYGLIYFSDATSGTGEYDGAIEYKHSDNFMVFRTGASERLRIDSSGRFMIGQTSSVVPFMVTATASNFGGMVMTGVLGDATSYASGVGGGLTLSGKYNSGGSQVGYAAIRGLKENGTDGNYAGALTLNTRPNGGNMSERLRINSSGQLFLGATSTDHANRTFVTSRDSGNYISIITDANDNCGITFGDSTNGTGNYETYIAHANATNDFTIYTSQGSKSFTFKSGGDLSISDGDLTIGTSGHGIDFSATANASQGSASNHNELLDDYEEGNWTPGIDKNASSMSGVSYGNVSGTYTKIGRMVTVWFDITVNSGGTSGGGAPYITQLPFAVVTGDASNGGYGAPQFRDATLMNSNLRIYGNSSYFANSQIYLQQYNSSGGTENSGFLASGRITGQGTYFTTT